MWRWDQDPYPSISISIMGLVIYLCSFSFSTGCRIIIIIMANGYLLKQKRIHLPNCKEKKKNKKKTIKRQQHFVLIITYYFDHLPSSKWNLTSSWTWSAKFGNFWRPPHVHISFLLGGDVTDRQTNKQTIKLENLTLRSCNLLERLQLSYNFCFNRPTFWSFKIPYVHLYAHQAFKLTWSHLRITIGSDFR